MEYIDTLKTINTTELKKQMLDAAADATDTFIVDVLKGEDAFACGFAWVNIYPKFKGNTKDGKAERPTSCGVGDAPLSSSEISFACTAADMPKAVSFTRASRFS